MALTTYQHRGHGSGCVPQRSYLRHCHRTLRSFALARYVSSRAMNGCSNFPGRSLPVIRSNPALRAFGGMVRPYGSVLVSSVKRSVGQRLSSIRQSTVCSDQQRSRGILKKIRLGNMVDDGTIRDTRYCRPICSFGLERHVSGCSASRLHIRA